jgi:F-type H+-transporting ATPase subunit gamma
VERGDVIRKRIETAEDLQSIVKVMKASAAVHIRQFERAVETLADYGRTIELGFQVVLKNHPIISTSLERLGPPRSGVIIFGSDQGMCGQLNEQVVSHANESVKRLGLEPRAYRLFAVGQRAAAQLELTSEQPVEETFEVPVSVEAITLAVQDLLLKITDWNDTHGVNHIYLFHARPEPPSGFRPRGDRLLPMDRKWLEKLQNEPWDSRRIETGCFQRSFNSTSLARCSGLLPNPLRANMPAGWLR